MGEKIIIHRPSCSERQPMRRMIRPFDSTKNMVLDQCPECGVEVLKRYEPVAKSQSEIVTERGNGSKPSRLKLPEVRVPVTNRRRWRWG